MRKKKRNIREKFAQKIFQNRGDLCYEKFLPTKSIPKLSLYCIVYFFEIVFPVQCGIECRLKTYGPKGTICNRGMSIHRP